jgi:hypothetical protein
MYVQASCGVFMPASLCDARVCEVSSVITIITSTRPLGTCEPTTPVANASNQTSTGSYRNPADTWRVSWAVIESGTGPDPYSPPPPGIVMSLLTHMLLRVVCAMCVVSFRRGGVQHFSAHELVVGSRHQHGRSDDRRRHHLVLHQVGLALFAVWTIWPRKRLGPCTMLAKPLHP